MTKMAGDADRCGGIGTRTRMIACVDQLARMFSRATERDSAIDPHRTIGTATRRDTARDRKKALAVGQLKPLGDDFAWAAKGLVDGPQRTGPAVPGKGKASAIEPF